MHTTLKLSFPIILGLLFLWGCKPVEKLKTKYRNEIDSIIVAPYLYNKVARDNGRFPIVFKDSATIAEVISTITENETPSYLCGYSGDIQFYCNDTIVLKGKYNHACNIIVLSWFDSDRYFRQRITEDGLLFYKALASRKLDSLGFNWEDPYQTKR